MEEKRVFGDSAIVLGVFSPSGPAEPDAVRRGVEVAERFGLRLRWTADPDAPPSPFPYLAGNDDQRLHELLSLLRDPSIDGLIAARGGYGAARLLPLIPWADLPHTGALKPLIGFSDLTALHLAAVERGGFLPVHGPVVTQLPRLSDADLVVLRQVVEHPKSCSVVYAGEGPYFGPPPPEQALRGPVVGGCLSILVSLLGTAFFACPPGSLLMIEDTGEPLYRIDRMLTQLRLAGVFERVCAVLVGNLTHGTTSSESEVQAVLRDRIPSHVPVLCGFPFGHADRNAAIPLGKTCTLDLKQRILCLG
jgi:muramoyltetrapeptide carboxypeptidase